jgi:hypothetical protein
MAATQPRTVTAHVPRTLLMEIALALDDATTIGMRSCDPNDHLHYANHDRLIQEVNSHLDALFRVGTAPSLPDGQQRT